MFFVFFPLEKDVTKNCEFLLLGFYLGPLCYIQIAFQYWGIKKK